jgi:hypothetical protein
MEIKLKSPENWSDITFKQWRMILDRATNLKLDDPINVLKYRLSQTQILNPEYSEEQIGKLKVNQLKEYFKSIEFLDSEPVKEIWKSFELDGKKYELIDFKNLSLEQWIDCEKYSNILDAHRLISIFYINPNEYNEIELDKISEYIDKQPCGKVFYLVSFFFFTQTALELATNLYSDQIIEMSQKIEKIKIVDQKIKKLKGKLQRWFGLTSFYK